MGRVSSSTLELSAGAELFRGNFPNNIYVGQWHVTWPRRVDIEHGIASHVDIHVSETMVML
jgi:hypothetical protein